MDFVIVNVDFLGVDGRIFVGLWWVLIGFGGFWGMIFKFFVVRESFFRGGEGGGVEYFGGFGWMLWMNFFWWSWCFIKLMVGIGNEVIWLMVVVVVGWKLNLGDGVFCKKCGNVKFVIFGIFILVVDFGLVYIVYLFGCLFEWFFVMESWLLFC